jgi:hypothetical protein
MQKRMLLGVLLLAVLVALPTTAQARLNPNPTYYSARLLGPDIVSGSIQVTNGMGLTAKPPLHGQGAMTFNAHGDGGVWDLQTGSHPDADIWIQCKPTDGSIAIDWGLYQLPPPNEAYCSYRYRMNGYGVSFTQNKQTKVYTANLVNYPFILRNTVENTEDTVYLTLTLTVQ